MTDTKHVGDNQPDADSAFDRGLDTHVDNRHDEGGTEAIGAGAGAGMGDKTEENAKDGVDDVKVETTTYDNR